MIQKSKKVADDDGIRTHALSNQYIRFQVYLKLAP